MLYLWMLSPVRGPQFFSVFWREFCSLIGARASLSNPRPMVRLKGRMKKWRQPSAAWFHRIIHSARDACSGWSMCIIPSPAPPLASPPFQCVYGCQPPIFPTLAKEVSCPSALSFPRQCRRNWVRARAALQRGTSGAVHLGVGGSAIYTTL